MLIDLGLVDGNNWNAFDVDSLENAINTACFACEVRMYVGSVAPTGWIFVAGQVVVNFQGLYPEAWGIIPASWKSGSNANMPNMSARFPIGQDGSHVLGAAGGGNTHTMVAANLPAHAHTIDHTHAGASGYTSDAVDHTYGTGGVHAHSPNGSTYFVGQSAGGPNAIQLSPGSGATVVNIGGTTAGGNAHQHDYVVSVPGFSGSSGNGPGSASAVDHTPAWVAFNFIMKVH